MPKNPYCPETIWQEYFKGEEPTGICEIHKEPDPDKPDPIESLEIIDGSFYINGKLAYLVGVSRREVLRRYIEGRWHSLSLEWYENEIIRHGLNYVRHDACSDLGVLRRHCERMRESGIVVEVTLSQGNTKKEGYFIDPYSAIDTLQDLPNVIFEWVNELQHARDILIAERGCQYCNELGLLSSAGAFDRPKEFELEVIEDLYNYTSIITVHRAWDKESILKRLIYGKPVVRNEYFSQGHLTLAETQAIMLESFEAGASGVNYYGFRIRELIDLDASDPWEFGKMLKFAGELCRELNK